VYRELHPPVRARYFRFQPTAWYGPDIAIRVELYGCRGTFSRFPFLQLLIYSASIPLIVYVLAFLFLFFDGYTETDTNQQISVVAILKC